jgi:hypothetical protein
MCRNYKELRKMFQSMFATFSHALSPLTQHSFISNCHPQMANLAQGLKNS